MTHVRKLTDGTRFSDWPTRNGQLPVVFLDYCYHHHSRYPDPTYHTLLKFKGGERSVLDEFLPLLARIARAGFLKNGIVVKPTEITSVLSSGSSDISPGSREFLIASTMAETLNLNVATHLFRQSPRLPLHLHQGLGFGERYRIVLENLSCQDARGKRILLLDDLLTTGATIEAYAKRIAERGGTLVGAVTLMKYEPMKPLNPRLFGMLET